MRGYYNLTRRAITCAIERITTINYTFVRDTIAFLTSRLLKITASYILFSRKLTDSIIARYHLAPYDQLTPRVIPLPLPPPDSAFFRVALARETFFPRD